MNLANATQMHIGTQTVYVLPSSISCDTDVASYTPVYKNYRGASPEEVMNLVAADVDVFAGEPTRKIVLMVHTDAKPPLETLDSSIEKIPTLRNGLAAARYNLLAAVFMLRYVEQACGFNENGLVVELKPTPTSVLWSQ